MGDGTFTDIRSLLANYRGESHLTPDIRNAKNKNRSESYFIEKENYRQNPERFLE